jgi:hypothetical protein
VNSKDEKKNIRCACASFFLKRQVKKRCV